MPSFQQHRETLERWKRLPALERVGGTILLLHDSARYASRRLA